MARSAEDDVRLGRKKILYTRLWWLLFHVGDYVWLVYSGTWAAYFTRQSGYDVAGAATVIAIGVGSFAAYVRLQCSSPGFVPLAPTADAPEAYDTDVLLLEHGPESPVVDGASGMELHYCRRCRVHQPLRAKHCKDCGRCVEQYDHQYCVCAGVCVGRDNHRIFVTYVVLQLLEAICALDIAVYGFSMQESIQAWFVVNLPYIVVYCCSLFTLLMAIPLTCYHIYLVLTNQTSWEHARRRQITYLRDLPDDTSPFSAGYTTNCVRFLMRGERSTWMGLTAADLNLDSDDSDENESSNTHKMATTAERRA
ncbi:hypothetical protein SPRG_13120 [Saprolegnia parasitica CBS 223.65]|uniref:Palmitoyltransferase n=1 Tax=Saprolegnia parasitica (strain CBS 223.65) TaxID=695850 RepID=A0A067BUI5_SAPPC|nr:hypothetical protein SPRG_13120 [Saprolegnia parasitica CBS 223.65]KDO21938.1 hypothetical protein SPRG_13120 [Saprolegnia parasitica CBS 223.65]|eukprot:XP_012207379.1 hypothetical protein SPRG_13120 [Saprolegnia parasitica CBS 223.65]